MQRQDRLLISFAITVALGIAAYMYMHAEACASPTKKPPVSDIPGGIAEPEPEIYSVMVTLDISGIYEVHGTGFFLVTTGCDVVATRRPARLVWWAQYDPRNMLLFYEKDAITRSCNVRWVLRAYKKLPSTFQKTGLIMPPMVGGPLCDSDSDCMAVYGEEY